MYTIKYIPEKRTKFLREAYWQVVRPNGIPLGPRFNTQEEAQQIQEELNMCLETKV
jgi:hypothetical protein